MWTVKIQLKLQQPPAVLLPAPPAPGNIYLDRLKQLIHQQLRWWHLELLETPLRIIFYKVYYSSSGRWILIQFGEVPCICFPFPGFDPMRAPYKAATIPSALSYGGPRHSANSKLARAV